MIAPLAGSLSLLRGVASIQLFALVRSASPRLGQR
jgi:hypothetical protein